MRKYLLFILILVAALSLGCLGYNLEGRGSNLPEYIKRVGIPPLENSTSDHTLGQVVTDAIVSEFINRGNFELTNTDTGVDALLTGEMTNYQLIPRAIDENGQATSFLVVISARVQFNDLQNDVVIWEQRNYQFRQEYQLSDLGADFVNMESEAVKRAAEEFARKLVNAILTGF